ncbi:MAG: hypothetical protein AB7P08_03810 [Burkholderiales bacterium]
MKRSRTQPVAPKRPPPPAPEIAAELDDFRVLERADGYWAQPLLGGPERGPFASLFDAIESERATDDEALEAGDTLAEVEAQLGLSDWIDPETSEPAEDSVPHLEEH